jgi:hypothetical protein
MDVVSREDGGSIRRSLRLPVVVIIVIALTTPIFSVSVIAC